MVPTRGRGPTFINSATSSAPYAGVIKPTIPTAAAASATIVRRAGDDRVEPKQKNAQGEEMKQRLVQPLRRAGSQHTALLHRGLGPVPDR